MYSIVEIGGHQYKLQAGDLVDVDRLSAKEGDEVTFDKVVFVGGESPEVGAPTVKGASVKVKVVRHDRDRKVRVFRRGVGQWRRTRGHRQSFTAVVVTEVTDGSGKSTKIDKDSKHYKLVK